MTKEVMKQALDALNESGLRWPNIVEAIKALKEALKQEQVEPVGKFAKFTDGIWREVTDGSAGVPLYTTPQTKEWVGLMRGVRVEGNSVIITVNGGNDEARFLCEELINEMAIYKEKT